MILGHILLIFCIRSGSLILQIKDGAGKIGHQ